MATYTQQTYGGLQDAYTFYNQALFDSRLPECLITLQRKGKCLGYFAADRFGDKQGHAVCSELALNPEGFNRDTDKVLSTLVHEMTHVQQHYLGNPPRSGYHNKAWGELMRAVGLIPSDTGLPGGKATGQNMSHYVEAGGKFEQATKQLLEQHPELAQLLVDIWKKQANKKAPISKAKYNCPACGLSAWAKPCSRIVCGDCRVVMQEG